LEKLAESQPNLNSIVLKQHYYGHEKTCCGSKIFQRINAEIGKQKLAFYDVEAFISKDDISGLQPSLQATLVLNLKFLRATWQKQKKFSRIFKSRGTRTTSDMFFNV